MKDDVIDNVIPIIKQDIEKVIIKYEYLKSGCYSDLFLANDIDNNNLLIKIYNDVGFAEKEYNNLTYLSELNSKFMKPLYYKDDNHYKFMVTKFIDGITLNNVKNISIELKQNLVDTIKELHSNTAKYFGGINIKNKYKIWDDYFVNRSQPALKNAKILLEKHYIDEEDYKLLIYTLDNIKYFLEGNYAPVLLHGDLTPWNIIVNNDETRVEGMIDPFDVCYGDKDYDLFLLEKGKGKELGLLECFFEVEDEKYKKKIALYSLWNEVKHYYYSKKKNDYSIKSYFEEVRKFL